MLADLAVQLIIYQFKRGFLWGIYRKKGLGLLWAKSKRNKQILWTEKGKKNRQKCAIWAPSHKLVGLYLCK